MKIPQKESRSQCVSSFFYTLSWEQSIFDANMDIQSFFYPDFAVSLEATNTNRDYVELIDDEHHATYLNSLKFLNESEWLITAYKMNLSHTDRFWVLDMMRMDEYVDDGKAMGWLNIYLEIDAIAQEVLPFRKPFL